MKPQNIPTCTGKGEVKGSMDWCTAPPVVYSSPHPHGLQDALCLCQLHGGSQGRSFCSLTQFPTNRVSSVS